MEIERKLLDLANKREQSRQGGGDKRIAKQHAQGKYSARERLEHILDDGSFEEFDAFVTHRCTELGMEREQPYTDGVITGHGTIGGRLVFVFSQDFTIFGGSLSSAYAEKICKIIAMVPNICEGKDQVFIDDLSAELRQVKNLMILDVAVDHARNRTVYSFTGTKEAAFEGGMLLYERALAHIDMRHHRGEHPRVGAVDVFPFVPLKDATIEDAIGWSVEFAEMVAERFRLPVYLFAESARYRYRRDLENIRQGEYEGFAAKMNDVRWKPDLGPDRFPEDSGVTIIGARYPLISFKVFLSCPEEAVADNVGHAVADTAGGHVRAYSGLDSASNLAMLTVSIINFRAAPMYRVVENIRLEAARFGVDIRRIEMIGLIPEIALIQAAEYYLRIQNFDHDDLLERNIQKHLDEKFVFGD